MAILHSLTDYKQGAGLELELSENKQVPIWDASATRQRISLLSYHPNPFILFLIDKIVVHIYELPCNILTQHDKYQMI